MGEMRTVAIFFAWLFVLVLLVVLVGPWSGIAMAVSSILR